MARPWHRTAHGAPRPLLTNCRRRGSIPIPVTSLIATRSGGPSRLGRTDAMGVTAMIPGFPEFRVPRQNAGPAARTHFIAFNCPSLPARFAAVAAERTSSKIERRSLSWSAAAKLFQKIDRDQCGATLLCHPTSSKAGANPCNQQSHKMDARSNTGFCCASQKRCIFNAVHD